MVINDDIYSLINYTNFIYFVCIILALAGLIKMKLKEMPHILIIQSGYVFFDFVKILYRHHIDVA